MLDGRAKVGLINAFVGEAVFVEDDRARIDVGSDGMKGLLAYLGPAIGPTAFEVGSEVREAFIDHDSAAAAAFNVKSDGKWLADLFMLGRQRLAACGVRRVYGGGDCTVADPQRFYSYRRDKITGRMAALIWLDGV